MNEDTQTPEEQAEERASQVPAVADFQDTPTASRAAQEEPVVDLGEANGQEFQPVDMNQIRSGLENASNLLSDLRAQRKTNRDEQERERQEQERTIQSEQEVKDLLANRQNLTQRITGAVQDIAGIQRERPEMEEEAGIPEVQREVTEIQNKQDERELFYRRQKEQVMESGVTQAQAQAQINSIERKEATELADLSIIENARLNRLDTAQALVDRKVQLAIEPLETEVQALKFQFNANEPLFTKAEQRLYQEQVSNRERERDRAEEEAQQLEGTKLTLTQNAIAQGAPNTTLEAIQNAETQQEALHSAGGFGVSLDMRLQQQQMEKVAAQTAESRFRLAEMKRQAQPSEGGRIRVSQEDAAGLNKEIASSDEFQSINSLQQSLKSLTDFEKLYNEVGVNARAFGGERQALDSKYTTALVDLKEYFNLGVLNGPDLDLLKDVLPDPTLSRFYGLPGPSVVGVGASQGRESGIDAGLENLKGQIETSLDSRFATIYTQYQDYDPDQVNLVKDATRKYLNLKEQINPEISQAITDMRNDGYSDMQIAETLNLDAGI